MYKRNIVDFRIRGYNQMLRQSLITHNNQTGEFQFLMDFSFDYLQSDETQTRNLIIHIAKKNRLQLPSFKKQKRRKAITILF
jgi:hypothetical protein